MGVRELSLYLHIPFCIRKCRYCDFLSWPASAQEQEEYLVLVTGGRQSSEHRFAEHG